jgi:hypothetical protein
MSEIRLSIPASAAPATNEINLRFSFAINESVSYTETIDAFSAGTYTALTQDGASGSITISINGGAFAVAVLPLALVATDTIAVLRTTIAAAGYVNLEGTYV